MNKLIKYAALIFLVLTWAPASAQTYKDEMQSLGAQNLKWFTENTPNLLKKTPYNIKDVTQEQLADTTKATPQEVIEIQKAAQQREAYQAKFTQIVNKYINPPEAARELLQSSNNSKNKFDDAAKKLASGSITYGQYNLLKQQIVAENMANSKKVVEKYDLFKSPPTQPEATSQPKPLATSPVSAKCYKAIFEKYNYSYKDKYGNEEASKTIHLAEMPQAQRPPGSHQWGQSNTASLFTVLIQRFEKGLPKNGENMNTWCITNPSGQIVGLERTN